MDSLKHDNQAISEAFDSTSRNFDDLLTINNPYFEGMVNQIYSPELQIPKPSYGYTSFYFIYLFHLKLMIRAMT